MVAEPGPHLRRLGWPDTMAAMTSATPAAAALLQLDHVSRQRGGRAAVVELCLDVRRGDVLGLLGVNGAGKSTTLAMVSGALAPHRGVVRIHGLDLREHPGVVREQVGWLPEHAPLYGELTVGEHLEAMGRLHGLRGARLHERRDEVLEALQLQPLLRRLVQQLSQGQKQRVGLACALLHDPPLVVVDEPTNGLDPVQAERWRELVRGLAAEHAVVISTHLLDEVTASCNRVAIVHRGRLRHDGPVEGNTRQLKERFMAIATEREARAA